jgi:FlaA1/EpsC-like NDP-sugar epimerase
MIFEISILILVSVFLLLLYKLDSKVFRRFGLAFVAVLLFQYFTQALWLNLNLEPWAYLYLDVAWILTVGWAGIIVVCMQIIELYFPKLPEKARYLFSIILIGIVGFFAEWVVVGLGIRDYPQLVKEGLSGILLGYGKVPIEALYYIPVFMALMVAFVRYWEINFDSSKTPVKKRGKK